MVDEYNFIKKKRKKGNLDRENNAQKKRMWICKEQTIS